MLQELLLYLAMLSALCFGSESILAQYPAWSHVELGAGNYGDNAYGGRSNTLRLAVAALFGAPNEDEDEDQPQRTIDRDAQYQNLRKALDQIIADRGPVGTFYVNDLSEDATRIAADHLRSYLRQLDIDTVEVVEWPGDFNEANFRSTTKNLANPELKWIWAQQGNPETLLRLIKSSTQGLRVTTYFTHEFEKLLQKYQLQYQPLGTGNPYIYPDGTIERVPPSNNNPGTAIDQLPVKETQVYLIHPAQDIEGIMAKLPLASKQSKCQRHLHNP